MSVVTASVADSAGTLTVTQNLLPGLSVATARSHDFFDVTSTDPAICLPSTNGVYPTLPGWDYVTGFGTPRSPA